MTNAHPRSIPDLLEFLRTLNPSSPRLIWYGPGQERIELSGKVLDNWVSKTSNLLVDELDAEPGFIIDLALPPHWKTLIWALASWQVGCAVRTSGGADVEPGDVLATVAADAARLESAAGTPVAVALGALDTRWSGTLPSSGLDYAAEVRAHGDVYFLQGQGEANDTALVGRGAKITFKELLPADASEGSVILLQAGEDQLDAVLLTALATWSAQGCVVLVSPDIAVTDRLLVTERISARPDLT
ncbi:TIGR03089 family protein [Arthrobacter roseus]|uniref:TIGR03089 family protein n=1 Tax=Arthrobacter roseus TaxID=136274 RepID=UPI001966803D|nr:TIGR03089 family protein [Arthrobacter roseus]MBM7847999.1 uncharacterized protein (TIGR03089 family) [Arthrobacter roseus]